MSAAIGRPCQRILSSRCSPAPSLLLRGGVARGFCARERGCVAAIGVAVELFVDRVAVVVARGGGVL